MLLGQRVHPFVCGRLTIIGDTRRRGDEQASILEERVGALKSTLSSTNARLGDLELQLALKNSDSDAAMVELEAAERGLRFAEDSVCLMREHVKNQGPQV